MILHLLHHIPINYVFNVSLVDNVTLLQMRRIKISPLVYQSIMYLLHARQIILNNVLFLHHIPIDYLFIVSSIYDVHLLRMEIIKLPPSYSNQLHIYCILGRCVFSLLSTYQLYVYCFFNGWCTLITNGENQTPSTIYQSIIHLLQTGQMMCLSSTLYQSIIYWLYLWHMTYSYYIWRE